jgi:hypothetical protein
MDMTRFQPIQIFQVAFLARRGTAPAATRMQWIMVKNSLPSPAAALGDGVGRSAANSTTLLFFKIAVFQNPKFNR